MHTSNYYVKRIVFFTFLMFTGINPIFAQWVQTNGPYGGSISSFSIVSNETGGADIFTGTNGGVFISTDNGLNWKKINNGLTNTHVWSLAAFTNGEKGRMVFAGTNDGIFFSSDDGKHWIQSNNGFTGSTVTSIAISSSSKGGINIFAGTYGNAFLSTDNGSKWTKINNGLNNKYIHALIVFPKNSSSEKVFAGTENGVFVSTDNGSNWNQTNLSNVTVTCFDILTNGAGNNYIFAGTFDKGIFLSTDDGLSWNQVNEGLTDNHIQSLAIVPNGKNSSSIFAGTSSEIFLSTNNGSIWTKINNDSLRFANAMAVMDSTIFIGTSGEGIFISTNEGLNWNQMNNGLTNTTVNALGASHNLSGSANIFAGTDIDGLLLSTNSGNNWIKIDSSINKMYFTNSVNTITIITNESEKANIFIGTFDGVFRSTDNGTSWIHGDLMNPVISFAFSSNGNGTPVLFAGTESDGILMSIDNGLTWNESNNGLTNNYVSALTVIPNGSHGINILAGTEDGIFISTNNGNSWLQSNSGLTNKNIDCFTATFNKNGGSNIFAGTYYGGIFRSSDNGNNWTEINQGLTNSLIWSLAAIDTNIFAGTSDGLFVSTNNGKSWIESDQGLTNKTIYSICIVDSNIFIGTFGGSVWKSKLTDEIDSAKAIFNRPIDGFFLQQNFPNPFNLKTTIDYSLLEESFVTIKIYDILGNEIATLRSEREPAGNYSINFNARNLPSGIYFYRMQAGSYISTKKFVLLK
ncbi:MAG: T9SS type A sorting domain-containing protein [Candidatus Thorarchaeota archaeon]